MHWPGSSKSHFICLKLCAPGPAGLITAHQSPKPSLSCKSRSRACSTRRCAQAKLLMPTISHPQKHTQKTRPDKKTTTARDVTGFYAIFSARKSAIFSTFRGDFLAKLHRKPGEKGKIHWREFKKISGDGAPKSQISVPCHGRTPPEKSQFTQ